MAKLIPLLRLRIVLIAIPVGAIASLVTLCFREVLLWINQGLFGGRTDITSAMQVWPWYLWPLIVAVGGVLAGVILQYALTLEKRYRLPTDYLEVINARLDAIPTRPSLLRAFSALASIASGASIGKEGPMVQLSALSGSLLKKYLPIRWQLETTDLVAMAAAAGLAAVYHAPLAAAIFLAEIAFGVLALQRLVPLIIASCSAVLTLRCLGYRSALYPLSELHFSLNTMTISLAILAGLLSGFVGCLFIWLTTIVRSQFKKIPSLPVRLGTGGLIVGLLSLLTPAILGNGYDVIVSIIHGRYLLPALLVILVLKLFATVCSVGSGAVGGMFTPSLLIGASLGGVVGVVALSLGLPAGSPWLFAAIGMASVLAAMSQAPLMAILMVLEMTMNSSLLLPLMLASSIATLVAFRFQKGVSYSLVSTHFSKSTAKFGFDHTSIRDLVIEGATLQPQELVSKALALSSIKRERYVYVIDENDQFLGVVSIHNIASQVLSGQLTLSSPVSLVIEVDFPCIYQDQTLREGWEAFTQLTLERLPVLDNPTQRKLVGALTKTSIIQRAGSFM